MHKMQLRGYLGESCVFKAEGMVSRQQRRRLDRLRRTVFEATIQVFTFTDADGTERKLDTHALRLWAEQNLSLVGVEIDILKIEDMIKNGRIDEETLSKYVLKRGPKPILVCDDFHDGKAEIVDGNHTYVAMTIAVAKAQEIGMRAAITPRAPAYVIGREIWTDFLIPG